jgi:hypothetical protein
MSGRETSERELWAKVAAMHGEAATRLGPIWSARLRADPLAVPAALSRYKFAAKMAAKERRVVELGCGEALGASILSESAATYLGVDADAAAIEVARAMWHAPNVGFATADPLDGPSETHDSVVCLELADRIAVGERERLFAAIGAALGEDGVAVVGASRPAAASTTGVAPEDLEHGLRGVFRTVFVFGLTGEMVHAADPGRAPYVLALACNKRAPGDQR